MDIDPNHAFELLPFPPSEPLYRPPITHIPPSRLALPDDLDHVPSLQTQIPRHRVRHLDPRQLRLLQPVPLQQLLLLLRAEQHVLRHELVVRDVDEQVLLLEGLDVLVAADGALDLERGGRDRRPRDHDPRVELVL